MAKFPKRKVLQVLSANLRLFFPHLPNHFICPLCLRVFDIDRDEKLISQAHLIPSAAGGQHSTLACRDCNSHLGANQDKWFAERVRLYKRKEHIFRARFKNEAFEIDGVKVNGHWEMTDQDGFTFQIHPKRNAPHIIAQLAHKFALHPNKITAAFAIPLAAKDRIIRIGYLTMAYLYWFTFLGYSWVMQRHLDIVREQILHPERTVINERCFSKFNNQDTAFDLPQFCAAIVSGIACASILYQDVQVFFPTPSSPGAYQQLEAFAGDGTTTSAQVKFFNMKGFLLDMVTGVIYDNLVIVLPDAMADLGRAGVPYSYVVYTEEMLPEPSRLIPVNAEEVRRLKQSGETIRRMRIRRGDAAPRPPRALLSA